MPRQTAMAETERVRRAGEGMAARPGMGCGRGSLLILLTFPRALSHRDAALWRAHHRAANPVGGTGFHPLGYLRSPTFATVSRQTRKRPCGRLVNSFVRLHRRHWRSRFAIGPLPSRGSWVAHETRRGKGTDRHRRATAALRGPRWWAGVAWSILGSPEKLGLLNTVLAWGRHRLAAQFLFPCQGPDHRLSACTTRPMSTLSPRAALRQQWTRPLEEAGGDLRWPARCARC